MNIFIFLKYLLIYFGSGVHALKKDNSVLLYISYLISMFLKMSVITSNIIAFTTILFYILYFLHSFKHPVMESRLFI